MMVRSFLALFMIVLPCLTWGAPIVVRSGEHGEFSRLVLRITPDVIWRALEKEGQYILELPDHEGGFDTGRVFQRISNERISGLTSNASTLSLLLNCDCEVKTFRVGSNFLVLDVLAGNAKVETNSEPPVLPNRDSSLSFGSQINVRKVAQEIADPKQPEEPLRSIVDVPFPIISEPRQLPDFARLGDTILNVEGVGEDPTAIEALDEARERLVQEFGTASTRGLLQVEPSRAFSQSFSDGPDIDVTVFDSSQIIQEDSPIDVKTANIRVTTSSDIEMRNNDRTLVTTLGTECIDPVLLEVFSWGSEGGLQGSLGTSRANLFGEFDLPNDQAVIHLARKYIYFGFGAEAISTLDLVESNRRDYQELYEISEILEFGRVRSTQTLSGQIECDSSAALWAILSQPDVPKNAIINADAALLSLNGLPLHLRRILAPELSDRLLKYGDKSAAKIALRSLGRSSEEPDMNASLAQANLDLTDGKNQSAESLLEAVVDSNTVQSARALITLIDLESENGRPIDLETARLAEAYSLELRDHQLGQELRRVHVLALAKSGQFDSAFEEFVDLKYAKSDAGGQELLESIVGVLSSDASDSAFLRHIFELHSSAIDQMSPSIQTDIASRFLTLGFADRALIILKNGVSPISTKQGKMLRAKASLALKKPNAALSILFEVDGTEAAGLRAQARSDLGQNLDAHEAFASLEDFENASANAWLSESWREVLTQDDPTFGTLVTAANTAMPNNIEIEGLLSRTEQSLSESIRTRAAISDMINGSSQF